MIFVFLGLSFIFGYHYVYSNSDISSYSYKSLLRSNLCPGLSSIYVSHLLVSRQCSRSLKYSNEEIRYGSCFHGIYILY